LTVDSVVTHLYPRGAGVHARVALDGGATLHQVVEALAIAAAVSSRGYGIALPIVWQELSKAGRLPQAASADRTAAVRRKLESETPERPDWMDLALADDPDALDALLELSSARGDGDGLDAKSRELLFLAGNACPAIGEREAIRLHARRAIELGASAGELLQVLRIANCIGLHAITEGILQVRDVRASQDTR
jgi:alkylhydroperoxidase/carboxymuconolactone decarboxylase family protein YurZ